MSKKQQLFMIEQELYLELLRQGVLERKELSKILNDFLRKYLIDSQAEIPSDMILKKNELETKLKELRISKKRVVEDLSILTSKIESNKAEEEKRRAKKMEETREKARMISHMMNNSDWMD
jgi:hypothetical protein